MVKKSQIKHELRETKNDKALKIRDESEDEKDEYGGELFGADDAQSGLDEFGLDFDDDDSDAPEMMGKQEAKSIFEKSYK